MAKVKTKSGMFKRLSTRSGWVTILALLSLGLASRAHSDELSDLLGRYQNWRGGEAFTTAKAFRFKGKLETSGLKGSADITSTEAGESLQKIDLGALKQTQAVTLGSGWITTPSGQIETLPGDTSDDARHETQIAFAGLLAGQIDAKLSLLAPETFDGALMSVVHIGYATKTSFDLFIDAKTGEMHGYRKTQDNHTTLVHESDWRIVDGVSVPYLIETTAPVANDNSSLKLDRVELNPRLSPDWLQRPHAAQKVVLKSNVHRTDWVPFDFVDGRVIYIDALVNGVKTRVLLDSGAAITVIDSDLAIIAGIKSKGSVAANGSGGTKTATIAKDVTIEIGDVSLNNLTVAVCPMAEMSAASGRHMSVILGKELLGDLVADIDFANKRIAFESPNTYTPAPQAKPINVTVNGSGLRTFDVSINQGPIVTAWFDLGNAAAPIALNAPYWKANGLDKNRPASVAVSGGVGGVYTHPQIVLDAIKIGDFEFKRITTDLEPARAFDSDRTVVNVGIEVWRRFHLITDYPHDKIYLEPRPEVIDAPFEKDRSGLALERKPDGLIVRAIAETSRAAKDGWQVGDKIMSADGVEMPGASPRGWRIKPAGTHVQTNGIDKDGKPFVRDILLEDFF